MDCHDRRVVLLAAAAAAGLCLRDDRLLVGQRQRSLERLVDVVRALHRARDRDATVRARLGDHRLVLDVELLLVPDAVLALDDQRGLGERGIGVAVLDLIGGEVMGRLERVEHRRQRLGPRLDMPARLPQRGLVRRSDERDRLGVVTDGVVDERRLVGLDEADYVVAGDVGGRHHDDARPTDLRSERSEGR